ncbi:MAG: hypothetical protein BGO76_03000 [Caedibacter sp. 38-128]|nr:DUF4280 domain-containing protein [Holosporales bacterium]OJX06456.1 MAG: hypothetical protein BGO76_03000 [Caedibacter sp. 38-128]
MATLVVTEALVQCAVGATPSAMTIIGNIIAGEGMIGNISSAIPFVNIEGFSVCSILAAATFGAKTECVPAIESWIPGVPTVLVGEEAALDQTSMLVCDEGGVITIEFPGQIQINAAA